MDDTISLIEKVFNITGPWLVIVALLVYVVNQVIALYVSWKFNKRGVVFSKLHEERAIVIKEMFQKLTILYQTLSDITSGGLINKKKTEEEHLRELTEAFEKSYIDTNNYFYMHRIYLPYNLCDKIKMLLSKSLYSGLDYATADKVVRELRLERNRQYIDEYRDECLAIRDKVKIDILGLLDEIELEFRNLVHGKWEGRKRGARLWLKKIRHKKRL